MSMIIKMCICSINLNVNKNKNNHDAKKVLGPGTVKISKQNNFWNESVYLSKHDVTIFHTARWMVDIKSE